MSETDSLYSNIFKTSKNNNMKHLNKLHNDISYDKYNNYITKTFFEKSRFDWEVYVSLMLDKLELHIIPDIINIEYNKQLSIITFDMSNLISLRQLFQNNHTNFHYIINELLSFLNTIKNKNVLIGNLNIDTVYINQTSLNFYILDISNTIFPKILDNDLDKQSLFISFDNSINNKVIKYFEKQMNNLNLSKSSYANSIIDAYISF